MVHKSFVVISVAFSKRIDFLFVLFLYKHEITASLPPPSLSLDVFFSRGRRCECYRLDQRRTRCSCRGSWSKSRAMGGIGVWRQTMTSVAVDRTSWRLLVSARALGVCPGCATCRRGGHGQDTSQSTPQTCLRPRPQEHSGL